MLLLGKPGLIFFKDSINYKHGGNLKETWNVINSSLGRKPKMKVTNELVYEGKDFVQKQDIAEQMNNHFVRKVANWHLVFLILLLNQRIF